MNIRIVCFSCDQELDIKDKRISVVGDILLEIKPCNNIDCYDCSKCEETKQLEKDVEELKSRLVKVREAVKITEGEKKECKETKKCYGEWEPNFQECQECKLRTHCKEARELSETDN